MSNSIISLKGLQKTFTTGFLKRQREVALKEVSCEFESSRCTGLLGHNGAGKTTAIRIMLGLSRPEKGCVHFKGRPINRSDRFLIGYMPEVNRLPPALTVEEALHYQLKFMKQKTDKKTILDKLELVGLLDQRKKRVGALSKGMARRLAWAQSVIHRPELLILDEPFSGLDPLGRVDMNGWISDLKKEKTSIIFCTHELKTVEDLCDQVNILNNGQLVYSSAADAQIRPSPSHTLSLSGVDQTALKRIGEEERLPAWQESDQEGYVSTIYFDDYMVASSWLNACLRRGVIVVHFGAARVLTERKLIKYFEGGKKW